MSTEPNIPTLFVGNADATTNNEAIGLGPGREPLVLNGPSQLLTQDEFDTYPSKLGVVLRVEEGPIEELTATELKKELDALGVDYPKNASKDTLLEKLTEARDAQVGITTAPATDNSGSSQVSSLDNPASTPPSLS